MRSSVKYIFPFTSFRFFSLSLFCFRCSFIVQSICSTRGIVLKMIANGNSASYRWHYRRSIEMLKRMEEKSWRRWWCRVENIVGQEWQVLFRLSVFTNEIDWAYVWTFPNLAKDLLVRLLVKSTDTHTRHMHTPLRVESSQSVAVVTKHSP